MNNLIQSIGRREMKVKDLIKMLKQEDQDATVSIPRLAKEVPLDNNPKLNELGIPKPPNQFVMNLAPEIQIGRFPLSTGLIELYV